MTTLADAAPIRSEDGYFLPLAHRYGSEWEMNFWDAIYYLAAHRGLPLGVTARTVATLMAGGVLDEERYIAVRHHFMRYWKEAVQAGWLIERTPSHQKAVKINTGTLRYSYRGSKRLYHFDLAKDSLGQGYLLKPRGYIENGWLGAISGVYPKRLLNFLLSQSPWPQVYPLAALINDFRIQLKETADLSSHPDLILEALDQLQRLNLIICTDGHCQLNLSSLAAPPPGRLIQAAGLAFQADWLTAQVEDPVRAQLALNVLKLSHWPQSHFWRVYRDLANLDNRHLEQVRRHLTNPASTSLDWTDFLQQIRLTKLGPAAVYEAPLEKQSFDFSRQAAWRLPLPLPKEARLRLEIGGVPALLSARLFIKLSQPIVPSANPEGIAVTIALVNSTGQVIVPKTVLELPPELPQFNLNFDLTHLLRTSFNRSEFWFDVAVPSDWAGPVNWQGQVWLELKLRA